MQYIIIHILCPWNCFALKCMIRSFARYLQQNIAKYTEGLDAVKRRCQDHGEESGDDPPYCESFAESNMKHAINGLMYDNNPDLVMKVF